MKKTFIGILGVLLLVSVVAFAAIIEVGEARTVVMVGGSVPAPTAGCSGLAYVRKNGAAGTSVGLTGVSAGNLIVLWLQWQDAAGDATVSDGSSSFSYTTTVNSGNQELGRFAYTTSSVASGSVTYTGTFPGGAGGRTMSVFEFTKTAGTISLDTSGDGATGSGTACTSAASNTTSTNEVIVGACGIYADRNYASATIGGTAVDQYQEVDDSGYGATTAQTSRVIADGSTITGCTSTINIDSSGGWVADMVSFKCE